MSAHDEPTVMLHEFIATRKTVPNLGEAIGADYIDQPGYVYTNDLYITAENGMLHLQLYGEEFYEPETPESLQAMEERLYDWACDEGYFDEEIATDDTRSNGPRA